MFYSKTLQFLINHEFVPILDVVTVQPLGGKSHYLLVSLIKVP